MWPLFWWFLASLFWFSLEAFPLFGNYFFSSFNWKYTTYTVVQWTWAPPVFSSFLGSKRVLSLPKHVLSDSPWSKDSIEWWNISVGQLKPILWPFLGEKVTHKKSGKSWNIFDLAEQKYKEFAFFWCYKVLKMKSLSNN